jgi:hypothetical protein
MKSNLTFMLLLFCLGAAAQKSPASKNKPAVTTLDLTEAVQQKKVSVTVEGNGGYTGEALKIICKNLSGKYLKIRIPQGQLMEPADSSMQTLVVGQEQLLSVSAKTPAEAALRTFCTQAGDHSPVSGMKFAVAALAPEKVCRLLKFLLEQGKLEHENAQAAVWCVTSGSTLGAISDPALLRFTAELLGKKPPGYHIKYETRDEPGKMADLGKALEFDSNFQYTLDKDDKMSLILFDAKGKEIKVLRKDEPTKAGEHRTSIHLKLWGLESGKYYVRMSKKNGALIKEMEIEF